MRKLFSALVCSVLCLSSVVGPGRAATIGRETVAQNTQAQATLTGTVKSGAGNPIAGATVTAQSAGGSFTAKTDASGAFTLALPPGVYTIVTNGGGFQSAESDGINVTASTTITLKIALAEANLDSLRVIGRTNSNARRALNTSTSAIVSVSAQTFLERRQPRLNDILGEQPGVTIQRGGASPNADFVIRGGLREALTEVDGHPVSSGNFGAFNTAYVSPYAFGNVEVTKGPGIYGPSGAQTVFGTVNLQTASFSDRREGLIEGGFDTNSGSFDNLLYKDALANGKFNIVLGKSYTGSNFGSQGFGPRASGTTNAVIRFSQDNSNPQWSQHQLVKGRFNFNDKTSISLEYLGLNGGLRNQGGNYATFNPNENVIPCTGTSKTGACTLVSQYNNPAFTNYIGSTIGLASAPGVGSVYDNEVYFNGELRTAFKNDTLLVRPYSSSVLRFIDGSNETSIPGYNGWAIATGAGACTGAYTAPTVTTGSTGNCFQGASPTPITSTNNSCPTVTNLGAIPTNACYIARQVQLNNGQYAYGSDFGQPEKDVTRGTTVTYIHPVGDNVVSLSFDTNSDASTFLSGDLSPYTAANPITLGNNNLNQLPTLNRKNTVSLETQVQLTPTLNAGLGLYFFNWKSKTYQEDPAVFSSIIAAKGSLDAAPLALIPLEKSFSHFDPHLGLTFRPNANTIVRGSVGSAVTVPWPGIASGVPSLATPAPNSTQPTVYSYSAPNPGLRPQTTTAFDVGSDFRLPNGAVVSVDAFNNLIYDAFAFSSFTYAGPIVVPAGFTIQQQSNINAGLRRNYGIEFTVDRTVTQGFGYRFTTTLQRNFFDRINPALFATPNTLVPLQQINGQPTVPFSKAYAEIRYAGVKGSLVTFGAEFNGANNPTNSPAYTIYNATLRVPIGNGLIFQMADDNISNYQTGIAGYGGLFATGAAAPTYQLTPGGAVLGQRNNSNGLRIPENYIRFGLSKKF